MTDKKPETMIKEIFDKYAPLHPEFKLWDGAILSLMTMTYELGMKENETLKARCKELDLECKRLDFLLTHSICCPKGVDKNAECSRKTILDLKAEIKR